MDSWRTRTIAIRGAGGHLKRARRASGVGLFAPIPTLPRTAGSPPERSVSASEERTGTPFTLRLILTLYAFAPGAPDNASSEERQTDPERHSYLKGFAQCRSEQNHPG